MRRIIKKIVVLVMLLSMLMVVPQKVEAAEPTVTVKVTTSANSVVVGKTIDVNIEVKSDAQILYAELHVNYDSSKFEFVSIEGQGASGSNYDGDIPIRLDAPIDDVTNIGAASSYKYKVVLKAKNTIEATKVTVSSAEFSVCDKNMDPYYPTATITNSGNVKIWAQGSDDATLKSIEIGGHSLSPAFAKWTVNYTVKVPSTTTSVTVSAQSTQGGRVEVKGNYTNLAYGNNVVTITSYAPNGKTMKYTVTIVRPEPVTEPPTEPTTEPPAWSEVVVDGITYNINSDYTKNIIPDGFEPTVFTYKGNGVLASYSGKSGLNLLYLVDAEKKGKFFIYDSEEDMFYPFIMITSLLNNYIVLPETMRDEAPNNCTAGSLTIGDYTIDGYINNINEEFAYFYAVNQYGERGWYCYDMAESTIQRMDVMDVEDETKPVEKPSEETTQPSVTGNDYSKENESLKQQNAFLKKIRNIAVPVAGVLAVVLLGLIIFLLAHKSEKEHAIPDENIDYVKMEKELDKEIDEEPAKDFEDEDISMYEAAIMSQFAAAQEEEVQPAEEILVDPTVAIVEEPVAETPVETSESDVVVAPVSLLDEEEFSKEVEEIPDTRMDIEKEIISLDDEEDFL